MTPGKKSSKVGKFKSAHKREKKHTEQIVNEIKHTHHKEQSKYTSKTTIP